MKIFLHTEKVEKSLRKAFGKHIQVVEKETCKGTPILAMNDWEVYFSKRGKARLNVLRKKYGKGFVMSYASTDWVEKYKEGYTKPLPKKRRIKSRG